MFGIKKSLNVSDERYKLDSTDNLNNSETDISKFIYYAKSEEFISQLEVYIKPNNYPDKKVLILTKGEVDFKEFYSQIKESLKSISDFKNISGLRIENLYKVQHENRINLPKEGNIGDYINSGDIIYCDIITDEFWIKTYFKIQAYHYKKIVKLEYKFHKKMKFKQIKLILLKAGIELLLDELKTNKLNNSYNYFVKGIKYHNKKNRKSQTGVEYEFVGLNKKLKHLDHKNEILVNLKLGIFEGLIHEQLASMELTKTETNYLRLNEYCNLLFTELLTSKKFEPELATVQDISREFLTSQYNDLNTPFLFYNCKKNETVEEYMYNMISNNSDDIEIEEDEEDEEFGFEGDTSFGKFYSEDPSKYFGNIPTIKKTKKSHIKKHTKFDSNMIILAPFLFIPIKGINNQKGKLDNNQKVYKTFSKTKEKDKFKQRHDLDKFFVMPLSLESNLLKAKQNNLIYNEDEDNDLILDTGQVENNINIDNDAMKEIYGLVNESHDDDNRYKVALRDSVSTRSKKSIFSAFRLSKQSNCCNDLYNFFSQSTFIENLKKKYKFYVSKKVLEKTVIPEARDYENIDKDFLKFINKKDDEEEDNSSIVKIKKLIFFIIIFTLYYLLIIIAINIDPINLFI